MNIDYNDEWDTMLSFRDGKFEVFSPAKTEDGKLYVTILKNGLVNENGIIRGDDAITTRVSLLESEYVTFDDNDEIFTTEERDKFIKGMKENWNKILSQAVDKYNDKSIMNLKCPNYSNLKTNSLGV